MILMPGVKRLLRAQITPEDATNKVLIWSVDNDAVVLDPATGVLTTSTAKWGRATITVTTKDGGFTATRKVTVINVTVTGIRFAKAGMVFVPNVKKRLQAIVEPSTATNKAVTWSSDKPNVATIDATTGELTTRSTGDAVITATTVQGEYSETMMVKVIELNDIANIMVNPSFEEPDDQSTAVPFGWTIIPAAWFTSYYIGSTHTAPANNNRHNNFVDNFFQSGNGAFFGPYIHGRYVARTNGSATGGLYQIIPVTPGVEYAYGATIGYRRNNMNNMSIKTGQTLKVLSTDGMTLYHETPIETDPSIEFNVRLVRGQFTIPTGVTQVRLQNDQRNFTAPNEAPLMCSDNFVFGKIPDWE
jgi:hypothetical protein